MLNGAAPLECVIGMFFDGLADADARRRLLLGRVGSAKSPVTVIDPVSRKNLTSELTGTHRSALIGAATASRKKLRTIWRLAQQGDTTNARSRARDLFVGSYR
jgi:hypothetical protein